MCRIRCHQRNPEPVLDRSSTYKLRAERKYSWIAACTSCTIIETETVRLFRLLSLANSLSKLNSYRECSTYNRIIRIIVGVVTTIVVTNNHPVGYSFPNLRNENHGTKFASCDKAISFRYIPAPSSRLATLHPQQRALDIVFNYMAD